MEEKQLTPAGITNSLSESMSLADIFVKSGMFPDIVSQAQAVVKILAGRELGLTPMESMTQLYMVKGRIGMESRLIASKIKKSEKYDYRVDKLDNEECEITFLLRNGEVKEIGKSSFTMKDAAKALLVNKDVWKSYPRNMMFARAMANGARFYCPDICSALTVEELRDIGEVEIEHKTVVSIDTTGEVTSGKESA